MRERIEGAQPRAPSGEGLLSRGAPRVRGCRGWQGWHQHGVGGPEKSPRAQVGGWRQEALRRSSSLEPSPVPAPLRLPRAPQPWSQGLGADACLRERSHSIARTEGPDLQAAGPVGLTNELSIGRADCDSPSTPVGPSTQPSCLRRAHGGHAAGSSAPRAADAQKG